MSTHPMGRGSNRFLRRAALACALSLLVAGAATYLRRGPRRPRGAGGVR